MSEHLEAALEAVGKLGREEIRVLRRAICDRLQDLEEEQHAGVVRVMNLPPFEADEEEESDS